MNVQYGASVSSVATIIHRSVLRKCTLDPSTHNNCVDDTSTILKVKWKWTVSEIRQKQEHPLTDCKYKCKLSVTKQLHSAESKCFRTRNRSERI